MEHKVLALFFCLCYSAYGFPEPAKLLRVPKIYNALITTNEKLLPSEAYPATTGQVFEPIGLTGDPVLLNPEAFAKKSGEDTPQEEEEDGAFAAPESPRPFAPSGKKMPAPLVFYPRYSVYSPYQPLLPYSYPYQPFLYSFGNSPTPTQDQEPAVVPAVQPEPRVEPVNSGRVGTEEVDREEDTESAHGPQQPSPPPSFISGAGYVKNNRPKNLDIPDVPPPPPPVGAAKPQGVEDAS